MDRNLRKRSGHKESTYTDNLPSGIEAKQCLGRSVLNAPQSDAVNLQEISVLKGVSRLYEVRVGPALTSYGASESQRKDMLRALRRVLKRYHGSVLKSNGAPDAMVALMGQRAAFGQYHTRPIQNNGITKNAP